MAQKTKKLKLFRRGKKRILYFKFRTSGKVQWHSTGTDDEKMARKIVETVMTSRDDAHVLYKRDKQAVKIASGMSDTIVKELTGKDADRIRIEDLHKEWKALQTNHDELSEGTQAFLETIHERFSEWCKNHDPKYEYIDEVSNKVAKMYAGHLWGECITPKTNNDHIKHLSRLFDTMDALYHLPNRNPFNRRNVPRQKTTAGSTASHKAFEPAELEAVISRAAQDGRDMRDLFVIGANTGLRLKDVALLKWEKMKGDFIKVVPYKTEKSTGKLAIIPISSSLKTILDERKAEKTDDEYVLPAIAQQYLSKKNSCAVDKRTQAVVEAVMKDKTTVKAGKHRKRNTCVYGFHSLRATFMSLLASKDVSTRDAMRIMAWESPEMIRVYEQELEKARGDADERARKLIDSLDELKMDIPEVTEKIEFKPTKEALEGLMPKYSNETIGKIYDMSGVAVKKWMRKFGLERAKRIESADVTGTQLAEIRRTLGWQG